MIPLFNFKHHILDTSKYDNLINGSIVREFEQKFCDYVGVKYGCAVDSETSAIHMLTHCDTRIIDTRVFSIPSMLPPVVANAIFLGGNIVSWDDNTEWIGGPYILHKTKDFSIIDSAHHVSRNCMAWAGERDIYLFSFYPTKPLSGIDGGMICSNDKSKIELIRTLANNGMDKSASSWEAASVIPWVEDVHALGSG